MSNVLFIFLAIAVIFGLKWHNQPAKECESHPEANQHEYDAVSHRTVN